MAPKNPLTLTETRGADVRGPLIAEDAVAAFDDVVGRAVARLSPERAKIPVQNIRAPLARIPDLLDQAAEVLKGNPAAAGRFREMLASLGGAAVPTEIALRVLQIHPDGKCSCRRARGGGARRGHTKGRMGGNPHGGGGAKVSSKPGDLIRMHRLEPVMAAAVYAARDAHELAILAGGIRLGLAGADEMNTLFNLARSGGDDGALQGAFDTAVRALGFAGFPPLEGYSPGEDGRPMPGFGPGLGSGPRGGVPWFSWPPPRPGSAGGPGRPQPAPIPDPPQLDPSLTEHFEQCMIFEVIPELHRRGIGFLDFIYGSPAYYFIESVSPDDACPGDLITIRGRNFEGVVAVLFVDELGRTISAAPVRANPRRIQVPLPAEAVSGPVWLYIPVTTTICLEEMTLARPGTPGHIRVGRPAIVEFGIEGGRPCVITGTAARLRWSATPLDSQVSITQVLGETESVLGEDLAASGDMEVDTTTPGEREFRIRVINRGAARACREAASSVRLEVREPTPLIEIVGVEVTQAIQVFNLAVPTASTNNSVPLIAGMDTVLRVFVRRVNSYAVRITGSLEFNGRTYAPRNRTAAYGAGPFIDAPSVPIRAVTNHSLNFLIPAADASGAGQTAEIHVFTSGSYCGDVEEEWTETLTWEDRPPLPVTVRRIRESDGQVLTEAQARALIRRAFRKMPSPPTAIALHPGVHDIRRGTTEDNYCHDGGYYELALSIAYEHNDNEGYPPDSHESSWIGLYSQTGCTVLTSTVNGMLAWPSTSTCIAEPDFTVAAHELMHTVGLGHTVTGLESCEDAFQPVACHRFPTMPGGALVEVPFDIENNTAVASAFELQSYRPGARWLCPELWIEGRRMMDNRY